MRRFIKYFMVVFAFLLMPFSTKASGSYSVEMVSGSANNSVIGTYNTYNEALNVMNAQNSSSSSVATIFRNGVPVDSKYAIFKFKPSGNDTYPLYRNASSASSYTSINTSYVGDAALLGYSDNGRVKIMVSGFTGWIDSGKGVVTPISLLSSNMININGSGVRLRSDHSTSSSIVASISGSYNFNYTDVYKGSDYTWYKINYNGQTAWAAGGDWVTVYSSEMTSYYNHYGPTGNLIHHFTVYSGGKYTDSFTNLGKSPSYLTKDVYYYSFDGNYFYSDVMTMLNDYRSGNYSHSVNGNSPHYSYYLYLTSRSTSGYSASDLDSIITSNGYNSSSKMFGTGVYFKEAEERYGTNALLAFSTALNESAWGTSSIAINKNNLFGYGASDSCPYECAYSYSSPKDSIMDYASKSSTSYETVTGKYYYGSHYGNKSSGKNIMYATDPYWGEKMAAYAYTRDLKFGGKDFNSNTIGVTKKGISNVQVYSSPDSGSVLYTMRNSKTSDPVYDFTANIVDKVTNNGVDYYKIYTDLSKDDEKFGYVLASSFNVSNSQPVINAKDLEIKIGDNFNYMNGVSASDRENGDLTNKITYEGLVDTSKEGTYNVTYSVADSSNFHASKKVSVKVVSDDKPIIEASNKEILQFSDFDYLEGVKAYNNSGLLEVTYEGVVDTSKAGEYEVIYTALNTSKKVIITVLKNEKPVIEAHDSTININEDFDYLDGVSATDKEDGKLEISYEGLVDTSKAGQYNVTYSASDKEGQKVNKEVTISVVNLGEDITTPEDPGSIGTGDSDGDIVENNLKKGTSEFYFDYLKEINGKLEFKGYNIIKEIDNTLNNRIKYYFVFENILSGEETKYEVSRITDGNEIFEYKENGKDYTYSWFKGEVKTDDLVSGDYIMRVVAESNDYYVDSVVSNRLLSDQVSNYKGKKYVTIINDYVDSRIPIIFKVREKEIGLKETSAFTNQYSYIDDISFEDGKLYIKGASYSSGLDMCSEANLTRKIIFENQNSFETYDYDLGFLNKGPYMISLNGKDQFGKDKDLAWYEKTIDLSNLEKGKYAIYITNKSNISDFGELKDNLMLNDYNSLNSTYKNKSYEFSLNKKARYRVELSIK